MITKKFTRKMRQNTYLVKRSFVHLIGLLVLSVLFVRCSDDDNNNIIETSSISRTSSTSVTEQLLASGSSSSDEGAIYEVLPGPAVMNPSMNPTPFSDNISPATTGSYSVIVEDVSEDDSPSSGDEVTSIEIKFTGSDGTKYLIDNVDIIHKEAGTGDHPFFGGVGLNKLMHGNTGIGTNLMPKMLSYITFWGITDLKNEETGAVIAANRLIHFMTATRVRDENLMMVASAEVDASDYNFRKAETHIILPPLDTEGNMSPVPGTAHGFLHMMFEEVNLEQLNRDRSLAYEILPGPAAINPQMSPTPFSNRVAFGAGEYSISVIDVNEEDSPQSEDRAEDVSIRYERLDGTGFIIDNINIIHKEAGTGDHTFFGGVGFDKIMHGNTGIGTNLMPKLTANITLWGMADLKNLQGDVLDTGRPIHIMIGSRVRENDLTLITAVETNESDPSSLETHIILPPQDPQGNPSPVAGTKHGFLHLMFEDVSLTGN